MILIWSDQNTFRKLHLQPSRWGCWNTRKVSFLQYFPLDEKMPRHPTSISLEKTILQVVGGCNPFEKYESKWESSPNRDEHKKYLKPSPRILSTLSTIAFLHTKLLPVASSDSPVILRVIRASGNCVVGIPVVSVDSKNDRAKQHDEIYSARTRQSWVLD